MELIAIALVIMLSIGFAVAATKLVMDALLAGMRLPHRDRANAPANAIPLVPTAILRDQRARRPQA